MKEVVDVLEAWEAEKIATLLSPDAESSLVCLIPTHGRPWVVAILPFWAFVLVVGAGGRLFYWALGVIFGPLP